MNSIDENKGSPTGVQNEQNGFPSSVAKTIAKLIEGPQKWMERSPSGSVGRKMKIGAIGITLAGIGIIVTIAALAAMGVVHGLHWDISKISFSLQYIPLFAIGVALVGSGIGFLVYQGLSCLNHNNRAIIKEIAKVLAHLLLLALAATLLWNTFGNGFVEGMCSSQGIVALVIGAFSLGVVGHYLQSFFDESAPKSPKLYLKSN